MARKRYKPEEIVGKVWQAAVLHSQRLAIWHQRGHRLPVVQGARLDEW